MNEPAQDAGAKVEPSFEEQLNRDAQQHAMTVYDQTLRTQRNSANDAICQYESMVAELRFKLGKISEKRQAEKDEAAKKIADLEAQVSDLKSQLAIATAIEPAPDAGVTPAAAPADLNPPAAPVATDAAPASVPAPIVQSIPAAHVIQAIDDPKSNGADTTSTATASVPVASDAPAPAAG